MLTREEQKPLPDAEEVGAGSAARSWLPGTPYQGSTDPKLHSLQLSAVRLGEKAPLYSGYFLAVTFIISIFGLSISYSLLHSFLNLLC